MHMATMWTEAAPSILCSRQTLMISHDTFLLCMDMGKSETSLVLTSRLVLLVNQHFHSRCNLLVIPFLWNGTVMQYKLHGQNKCYKNILKSVLHCEENNFLILRLTIKQRTVALQQKGFIYLSIQSWFPITKCIKQIQKANAEFISTAIYSYMVSKQTQCHLCNVD